MEKESSRTSQYSGINFLPPLLSVLLCCCVALSSRASGMELLAPLECEGVSEVRETGRKGEEERGY